MKLQARIGGCSAGYNDVLLKTCEAGTILKLNKLAMKRFIAMVKKDTQNFLQYMKILVNYFLVYLPFLEKHG
jgi:hypothetical protein